MAGQASRRIRAAFSRATGINPASTDQQRRDWEASAAGTPLPGTTVEPITEGDHEVLLDDSRRLAERAADAGVDVTLEIWPLTWHARHAFAAELPEVQAARAQIGAYVRGTAQGAARTR